MAEGASRSGVSERSIFFVAFTIAAVHSIIIVAVPGEGGGGWRAEGCPMLLFRAPGFRPWLPRSFPSSDTVRSPLESSDGPVHDRK